MVKKIIYTLLLLSAITQAQDRSAQLLHAVARDVVYLEGQKYYLVENSFWNSAIEDSLKLDFPKQEIYLKNPGFPTSLLGRVTVGSTNWRNQHLDHAVYISEQQGQKITQVVKEVVFVDDNIPQEQWLKINDTLALGSFAVRKNKSWNKQQVWQELEKTWNETPIWRKMYLSISCPVFSADYRYARIAVTANQKCQGQTTICIYKNENNDWTKIAEILCGATKKVTSHVDCEDLIVQYQN
ncbi:hypothetical protein [Flavobacterium sp.]|uniref:hypothetical protein n=1 Tax=Flavobacterium sp. TaxID=239 RepID=UPI0039E542E4